MPPYSFPILGIKEIVNSLANLGIGSVTADQLMKINSETAAYMYECLAKNIMTDGSGRDDQPLFCGLEVLEDLELHRDSVGIINNIRKVQKVMRASGAHDFSSKDIFKPDPQRTVKFLSALINLYCYKEDKLTLIGSTLQESDQELEKEILLKNRKKELELELAEIDAERQSKQPQIEALESEIKELNQNILALNKQQSNLQAEVQTLKEKNIGYNDKIRNANFLLLQKTQEAMQQQSLIVQSPDKLQKALEEKRALKTELEMNVESAMESYQKWNTTNGAYTKAHNKVRKSLALVQALQEQINSFKTVEKDVKSHKAKLKDAEKEDWALEAKRVELQLEVEQLERAIKNIESEKEVKCAEAEKELDALNAQLAPRLQELERAEKKLAEKFAEAEFIRKRRIAEVSASKETVLSKLVNKHATLSEKLEKYNQAMLEAFDQHCGKGDA
ncbi:hypothetical protein SUGI_0477660 [Cryptomeria japonica]|uniref:kinetochore protein NUF2 homolog n=1 Tax=Cryptomeria japonica TaxID=3369 RepID=UPI002408A2DC|nr:kinetochore protein NUF2 homolog [Cryptomeria japonica]GLJ24957.1 hypothetical protein SUGI_0477660 [Cryptomeria japonica]